MTVLHGGLTIRAVSLAALLITLSSGLPAAGQDGPHCPAATPVNSSRFYGKDADSSRDHARLAVLAKSIVTSGSHVCLLALMDPSGTGYSKKQAIFRVVGMRSNLVKEGVSPGVIAYELRPAATADDPDMPSVLIIVSP